MYETDYIPRGRPFTGRKMTLWTVGFFAVVIAANMALLVSALDAWPGLVVENSYVASQDFDETRAAVAAREARGWQVALADAEGRPELTLTGADGAPLSGLILTVLAHRPASAAEDRVLTFGETMPGRYAAAERLPRGRWGLQFTAEGRGRPYRKSLEIEIR